MRMTISFAVRVAALFVAAIFIADTPSTPQESASHFYLGFDRNDYPGDAAMKLLRRNFAFTGYWLGNPPGEKTNTWIGKRALLRSEGFGFLVLYRGRESSEVKTSGEAMDAGTVDAKNAATAAKSEGFASDIIIFLDIEEGGRLPTDYLVYLVTWFYEIQRAGYHPGVYCSGMPVEDAPGATITTADNIRNFAKSPDITFWVFNDACPPSQGCTMQQDPPAPSKGGIAYAQIWQFVRSPRDKQTARHCRGYAKDGNCYAALDTAHRFHLDVNSATSPDPSGGAK